jgi:hypothetical protein
MAVGARLGPTAKTLCGVHAQHGHRVRGARGGVAAGGGSSVKVSTRRRREHPWSKGSTWGKLRRSGVHPITSTPVRQIGGGDGHDVMVVSMLWWSATTAKGSCSLRGPWRGERRSTMRMTVVGGVISMKSGRNGGGGSNSDGGSGAPVARRRHKDEGERGGVLARLVKERRGGGEKGRNDDEVDLLYQRDSAAWRVWGSARDGTMWRGGGEGSQPDR